MPREHPALSGALGRCVECGSGKLYSGYLKVSKRCNACGFDLETAGAGDAPVTSALVLVGAIGMAGVIYSVTNSNLPAWAIVVIWSAVVIILSLAILPPLKGALIGLQHHVMAGEHAARPVVAPQAEEVEH